MQLWRLALVHPGSLRMDTQTDALSKVSLFKRGDFGYLYLHQPVSLRILNPKLWKHRTLVMIPRKGHQNQQWSWHPTTSQGFLGFAMLIYRYMDGSYSNGIRFCNALQISGFDSNIFILRETIQLDQHMFQLGGSTVELLFAWFESWAAMGNGPKKKWDTKFSTGSTHLFLHPQRSTKNLKMMVWKMMFLFQGCILQVPC